MTVASIYTRIPVTNFSRSAASAVCFRCVSVFLSFIISTARLYSSCGGDTVIEFSNPSPNLVRHTSFCGRRFKRILFHHQHRLGLACVRSPKRCHRQQNFHTASTTVGVNSTAQASTLAWTISNGGKFNWLLCKYELKGNPWPLARCPSCTMRNWRMYKHTHKKRIP